jgi:hypothetical protein
MRKGDKKHHKELPCFHANERQKVEEGVFLLHKECFQIVSSGKIDEKKWKL